MKYQAAIGSNDNPANLDDYTTVGTWWVVQHNDSSIDRNSLVLEVIPMGTSAVHIMQRATFMGVGKSATIKVYVRGKANDGWTAWTQLASVS